MKDRLQELQEMIEVNESLDDAQVNIPIIRSRRRRLSSEFLNCFTNDFAESSSITAISESTSVEDFEVQEIRENIYQITENVECLKQLHFKILSNTKNKNRVLEKLDEVTIKIENSINIILEKMKCKTSIHNFIRDKSLSVVLESNILENLNGLSEAQLTICRNQSAILSRKFFVVMSNFNEAERLYQENLQNITHPQITALDHIAEAGTSRSVTRTLFMDKFFVEVKYARYLLHLIPECVEKVERLYSLILSEPREDPETRKRLEDVIIEAEHLANIVMEKLILISNSIMYNDDTSTVKQRIRRNHYELLLRAFVENVLEYNNTLTYYYERCKEGIKRWLYINDVRVSNEQLEVMAETGDTKIYSQWRILSGEEYSRHIEEVEARRIFSGYKSRNDMQRDILYLKLLIFCINHQMTTNDKSLERWVDES